VLKRKVQQKWNRIEFSKFRHTVRPRRCLSAADYSFFDPIQIKDRLFQQPRLFARIAAAENPAAEVAADTPVDRQDACDTFPRSGFCPADFYQSDIPGDDIQRSNIRCDRFRQLLQHE
jgi:hypothetical protein